MATAIANSVLSSASTTLEARKGYLSGLTAAIFVAALIMAVMVAWRVYQGMFAWKYGMESTAPEFDRYWMGLMYVNLGALTAGWVGLWSYLWFTRDRHLDRLHPRDELRRYINLILWLLVYAFIFYFAGSFFAEEDASWHQTVVRDTSFTPSHIVLFYGTMPLYVMVGVGTFLYATTRLPKFATSVSIPLVLVVFGPALILPNLGYNEWGHAFWLMEEWFTAPLHWGFVVFGWALVALGGVLMQIVAHLRELFGRLTEAG
jgi:methane/ammonia monooxygenase subunit C